MSPDGAVMWKTLLKATRLSGWRLSGSRSWKLARFFAVLLSVAFTLAVVILGASGRTAGVHAVLTRACVWVAWLAAPFVAWWAASDRGQVDRKEGLEGLARLHAIDEGSLRWGRAIAATVRLATIVLAATSPVLVATMACAPTFGAAWQSLLSLALLAAFALGVGVAGGGLAAVCGAVAPSRGRTLLFAVVVLPWTLDGVITGARAGVSSVPGLLGWLAELAGSLGAWS